MKEKNPDRLPLLTIFMRKIILCIYILFQIAKYIRYFCTISGVRQTVAGPGGGSTAKLSGM